jgi:hypothetical protein
MVNSVLGCAEDKAPSVWLKRLPSPLGLKKILSTREGKFASML